MWYYFAPGFVFLVLTSLLLFFLTPTTDSAQNPSSLIGQKAPAILAEPLRAEQPMPNPVLLAANLGHPVLINFFASWCTPCEAELPMLATLHDGYHITIIGIAWNDQPDALSTWLQRTKAPFDFIGRDDGQTAQKYRVRGVPETLLLDAAGTIIAQIAGPITPEIMARDLIPHLKKKAAK
ncbi:MAG: redoxin domain-containing protein [Rickettsiales bacterium]|nr:redoxin domain-containing protein [Rickettsiales bacterium]